MTNRNEINEIKQRLKAVIESQTVQLSFHPDILLNKSVTEKNYHYHPNDYEFNHLILTERRKKQLIKYYKNHEIALQELKK